jgi:hypothetical protein
MEITIMRFRSTGMLYFALLAMATGCAKSDDLGLVSAGGHVNYKGQPLAGAIVTFLPQGGRRAAVATTDASGEFELSTLRHKGVVAGTYKVTVTKTESPPTTPESASKDPEAMRKFEADLAKAQANPPKSLIPTKYAAADSTPFSFEVKQGEKNDFTLDLAD